MKNTFKLIKIIAIVAVIGLTFISCDPNLVVNPTTGKLTINGLGNYNGKYIFAMAFLGENNECLLLGADGATGTLNKTLFKCVKIENGSAALNVWITEDYTTFDGYTGNDSLVVYLYIVTDEFMNPRMIEATEGKTNTLRFNNGVGAGTFSLL